MAKTTSSKSSRKQLPLQGLEKTSDTGDAPEGQSAEEPITNFWDDLLDSLPPWLDELIAIMLLLFGVLSFISLFNPSDAIFAVAWANIVTSLFGYGSVIVSAGLFLLGIILLLPKAGITIQFPPYRILAIELAFLTLLAILHLVAGDTELRAVARAGEGGGIIGWGLGLPSLLIGRSVTLFIYGVILAISLAVVMGVRKEHLKQGLGKSINRLKTWSYTLTSEPSPLATAMSTIVEPAKEEDTLSYSELLQLTRRRTPLMRIRPDQKNIPPSLRNIPAQPTDLPEDMDTTEDLVAEDHPLFTGQRQLKSEFNAIGEPKGKSKDGKQLVVRPDGRVKHYFTVESMKESRKIGRREKALPDLEMLRDLPMNMPEDDEVNRNVVLIENTLLEFDIDIDVVDVQVGPTVTRYAVQPFKEDKSGGKTYDRTRVSKIASLANDLSLSLSAKRLRLEAPVPGENYMGIEVPNKEPSVVSLRSVYESRDYYEKQEKASSPLLIPLGRDVSGKPVAADINKMPHLLIAGTTGSGKSVCIAALATSLILSNTPDKVKMVMLDPKMVELSRFNGLPHLLGPVETDLERIIGVLRWCTREMDRRYKLLEEHAARNIETFNARQGSRRRGGEFMPYIVIMIDEIGDLMMSQPEETEKTVTRLAQMARAVGMHLVVATQRPSVDVITGLIKANFPTRISFAVASGVDSRVILDATGAETLLGHGDMLFLANDAGAPRRIQGCYVSDDEVRAVVDHWKDWYNEQIKAGKAERIYNGPWERGLTRREFLAETDPMLEDAIELVVQTREASASMIQRRLGLGYPRAARIMDMLEELGVIGKPVGGGRNRKVLIAPGQDAFKKALDKHIEDNK